MKLDFVKVLIAIAVSSLITYWFYSQGENDNKLLLSCGSFIFLTLTLVAMIGVRFELPRTTINIRIVAGIFFIVALISSFVFSFLEFSTPTYIIINGILLLVYMLIVYSINKAEQ